MIIGITVEDVLWETRISEGWHQFGEYTLQTSELRPLLEQAHDTGMPDWPAFVALFDEQ
jgi:hypothetical protein